MLVESVVFKMPDDSVKVSVRSTAAERSERRRHPRYSFTAAVQVGDTVQRSVLNARISDLSRGGCYVDAFSPFPLKTGVKPRIISETRSFEAHADVVYSKLGTLDRWLAELSGAIPFEPVRTGENGEIISRRRRMTSSAMRSSNEPFL